MQTDENIFNEYLEELVPQFKNRKRKGADGKFEEYSLLQDGQANFGQTCQILDSEQVNCFIFDSLCNDIFLRRMIEHKRKYEITTNFLDFGLLEEIDGVESPSKVDMGT